MSDIEEANRLYDKALIAARLKKADKKAIIAMLTEAWQLGSGQAAWALGDWARRGVGNKPNPTKATKYFRMAAEMGSSEGAFDYAKALETGYGRRKNARGAREAYLLSAMLGDGQGAFEYVRCLWHGIGGKKDRTLAEAARKHFEQIGRFTVRVDDHSN